MLTNTDPIVLDRAEGCVWRDGERIPLKAKAFAVLCYLADHQGKIVTKEALLQAVWPGVVVSDWVLTTCIREVRRALKDTATTPRWIETVHRRGYRFLQPLATPHQGLEARDWGLVPSPPLRSESQVPSPKPQAPAIVGREPELARLQELFAKALHGERQVVFVTGEPGMGKTALIDALRRRLEAGEWSLAPSPQASSLQSPASRVWLGAGQCIEQFGEGEAYLPLLTALSQLGQGPEGQRLAELLKRYAPTWLLQLPSLLKDEDLTVLQQRTIGATSARMVRELAEALEALTAEQPVILVLEDLHWSDHATVNWLAFMARRRQPARLLVAATYRPVEILSQSHPLRPVLQELLAHQHCVELPLRGLTAEEVETYVDQRFPASALPTRLPQLLHRQTEGNPLFLVSLVEELVANGRVVVQNGHWVFAGGSELAALSVPDNIRQLVARQRERLSPEEQQVLGAASVAGLEFPTAAVAAALSLDHAVVEAHCQQLAVRQHFLRRAGIQEWPDGTRSAQYGFLHALYQQLWHEQVSAPHLQQWHLRIGQRKEAAYNGRAPEIAAELALHFEQGGDQGRAVEYLQHAVNNALQRSAHQEALVHLTRGLRLLHTLPDTPERGRQELIQQVALGEALIALKGYAAPEVRAAYARARELCQRIEDLSQLLPLAGLYKFSVVRGDYHTGRELALAVLELAERVHDPTLFMVAHAMLGYVLFFSGELVAASDQLERSIALYDLPQHRFLTTFYGDDPKVASLGFLAWLRWLRGYPDQAVQSSREAWSLAQELAHPYVLTMTSGFTAQLACFRREGPVTRRQAEVALAQAREHGFPLWSTVSTILRGWALMEQGETEAGLAQLREGLSAYQTLGADSNQPHYLALLAQAYEKAGQYEQALEALDQALALLTATGECFYEAELYRLKGELLLKVNASRDV